MNSTQRLLLFIFLCIPFRLLLVTMAKRASDDNLKKMGLAALVISLGFFYQNYKNGKIGAFGEPVWWNRMAHSVLHMLFAIAAIHGKDYSWMLLMADITLGMHDWVSNPNSSFNAS